MRDVPGLDEWVLRQRPLPKPPRRTVLRRAWRVTRIFAVLVGPGLLRRLPRVGNGTFDLGELAEPLRRAFTECGGTFVKFGQIIASSPGIFGEELTQAFRSCLDTGPVVPFERVRQSVETSLGRTLEEIFTRFERDPIGSASIATVYRAQLRNGDEVAVKVLRPDVALLVATDLAVMEPLFRLLTRVTGTQIASAMTQQLDGLRQQIGEELDLRNECVALERFTELTNAAGLDLVVLPHAYADLSASDVLVMEYLDGIAIDDLAEVERLGLDPAPLIDQLVRGFFLMTVRWGAFHGDIHAGNLLLLRDGRVGVIDWGIVGRLDADTHRFFVRLLQAVVGDADAWNDVTNYLLTHYGPGMREALGLDDAALAQFVRGMVEPILLRPFGEVSFADMLNTMQQQVATANNVAWEHRTWRGLWRRLQLQRKVQRLAEAGGGLMTSFDRGNFLLGKQLMYFERYGRLYLADRAILSDRDFLEALLRQYGVTHHE